MKTVRPKSVRNKSVRTKSVRPELVEGVGGVEGVEGFFNQLIHCYLISAWFDKLTTNGLNQRFANQSKEEK